MIDPFATFNCDPHDLLAAAPILRERARTVRWRELSRKPNGKNANLFITTESAIPSSFEQGLLHTMLAASKIEIDVCE